MVVARHHQQCARATDAFVLLILLLVLAMGAPEAAAFLRPKLLCHCRVASSHPTTTTTITRRLMVSGGSSSSATGSNDTPISTTTYNEDQIDLPNGVSMQVLSQVAPQASSDNNNKNKPVVVFLHGSFHGAWCWAEHWFAYFCCQHGYTVVAPSWRGTGGTFAGEGVKKVQIGQHVDDLQGFLQKALPEVLQRHGYNNSNNNNTTTTIQPVVVCHSFGGLAVMKYLEDHVDDHALSGVVTICSVPPSGNGKMTMRYLRRSLKASWKITVGFAMKKCLQSTDLCRQLFFGGDKILSEDGVTVLEDYGISDADVERYQSYFARDTVATIDLLDLAKILPSSQTNADGVANFMTRSGPAAPPCLVMGAKDDYIVDQEGLEETARYFGLEKPLVVDSPHDVMLGKKWENGAASLREWLEEKF